MDEIQALNAIFSRDVQEKTISNQSVTSQKLRTTMTDWSSAWRIFLFATSQAIFQLLFGRGVFCHVRTAVRFAVTALYSPSRSSTDSKLLSGWWSFPWKIAILPACNRTLDDMYWFYWISQADPPKWWIFKGTIFAVHAMVSGFHLISDGLWWIIFPFTSVEPYVLHCLYIYIWFVLNDVIYIYMDYIIHLRIVYVPNHMFFFSWSF